MADSAVAIANRALQKLGKTSIESLTQDHPHARHMNTAYDPVRRDLLREYAWSFAIARASLAALSVTVTGDSSINAFQLPNGFLRLLRRRELLIVDDIYNDMLVEGDRILTYEDAPLFIRYVKNETDPTKFDPCFDEAFAARLAVETCEAITQSNTKKRQLEKAAMAQVAKARRLGFIEKGPIEQVQDEWLDSMR